ncbi:MAG: PEP-CTERM sorting domain-containing protein [Planctomycetota bacterium]
MKPFSTRNLVAASCMLAAASPLSSVMAQVSPGNDETVEVTSDSGTWIQIVSGNGIDIPLNANGVTINNGLGGMISGDPNAIITQGLDTTVNNGGNIAGAFNGINFFEGSSGTITNVGTGNITSNSRAINLDGLGGPVIINNFGNILGTGNQRNGTIYGDADALDFTVNNFSTGIIDSGIGNQGSGVAWEISGINVADLINAGIITGRTVNLDVSPASGLSGDGVRIANFTPLGPGEVRIFQGSIINEEGGLIQSITEGPAILGTIAGLRVADGVGFQGVGENAGTITGVQNGVYFGNGDHTGGVYTNSGLINSDSRAFNIDGTGLIVNNSGDILGTASQRNGTVYADGTADDYTFNNLAGGVIDAGLNDLGESNEGSGFGAEIGGAEDGANTFILNNAGTIQGRGNAGAGLNTAGDGVRIGNVTNIGVAEANITNTGTINSEGANGTVAGVRFVNGISFSGVLDNSGDIFGVQNGLYFGNAVNGEGADHSNGLVNNSGTISSDSRALNIDGTGLTVVNSGTILGTGNQRNGTAYADSTAQDFSLVNSGIIDAGEGNQGAGFSVELSEAGNDFTIVNDGDILGRGTAGAGSALAGDGLRFERTRVEGVLEGSTTGLFTGTVINSGDISSEGDSGTTAGVRFVNGVSFQGLLTNTGSISGIQNGVYFGNPVPAGGADHTSGVVNNFGLISSDSRAFNVDGIGLVVNNAGDIVGSGRQRNGTFYVDGTGTGFTLNNLSGGTIDAAGLGGEGSGVSIQVGVTGDGVGTQTGSINNAGLIAGAGDQAVDAGIRLFAPESGDVFQGNIINTAGGVITAETAPAILIEEGVTFAGNLVNNGTIDGSVSFATPAPAPVVAPTASDFAEAGVTSAAHEVFDVVLGDNSLLVLDIAGLLDFETFDVSTHDLEFGGVLELNFVNDFFPQVGDSFDLFDFASSSGQFSAIQSGEIIFDTTALNGAGVLTVAAVPEPSSLALLALGASLLYRRRRSN